MLHLTSTEIAELAIVMQHTAAALEHMQTGLTLQHITDDQYQLADSIKQRAIAGLRESVSLAKSAIQLRMANLDVPIQAIGPPSAPVIDFESLPNVPIAITPPQPSPAQTKRASTPLPPSEEPAVTGKRTATTTRPTRKKTRTRPRRASNNTSKATPAEKAASSMKSALVETRILDNPPVF